MPKRLISDKLLTHISGRTIILSLLSVFAILRQFHGRTRKPLNASTVGESFHHGIAEDLFDGRKRDLPPGLDVPRLLVGVPFTFRDVHSIQENLEEWRKVGPACESRSDTIAELWFYYNTRLAELPESFQQLKQTDVYQEMTSRCFARVQTVGANLTAKEDDYPGGINLMFYRLLTGATFANELLRFEAVYWMEPDVFPIKPFWLDALVREALWSYDDYWVKGSVYLGEAFDNAAEDDRTWVGHINGNALYRLHQPLFTAFLQIVMDIEPPDHYWKPFDVSIWKVLNDFPYFWHAYQRIAKHFVYSDFVHHWNILPAADAMKIARDNRRTFLVHGKNTSAGNTRFREKSRNMRGSRHRVNWDGAIDPTADNVSVFMRGRAIDIDVIRISVSSVLKYMPGAIEIVIVVPDQDITLLLARLGSLMSSLTRKLQLLSEKPLLRTGKTSHPMQETYTMSIADNYCRGSYIFHLQTNSVLIRKVYHKDLFLAGKPIIWYTDASPTSDLWWSKGIITALGERKDGVPRRVPGRISEHVIPRGAYEQLRGHIGRTHGISIESFLKNRVGAKSCLLHDPASKCFPEQDGNHVAKAYSHAIAMGVFLLTRISAATVSLPLAQSNDYSLGFSGVHWYRSSRHLFAKDMHVTPSCIYEEDVHGGDRILDYTGVQHLGR